LIIDFLILYLNGTKNLNKHQSSYAGKYQKVKPWVAEYQIHHAALSDPTDKAYTHFNKTILK